MFCICLGYLFLASETWQSWWTGLLCVWGGKGGIFFHSFVVCYYYCCASDLLLAFWLKNSMSKKRQVFCNECILMESSSVLAPWHSVVSAE